MDKGRRRAPKRVREKKKKKPGELYLSLFVIILLQLKLQNSPIITTLSRMTFHTVRQPNTWEIPPEKENVELFSALRQAIYSFYPKLMEAHLIFIFCDI